MLTFHVCSTLPRDIQVLLFSATFPDKVLRYADQFAPKAIKMTLAAGEQTVKGISQMYMDCPSENDKYDILCKLYGLMTIGSSVIFVKVCRRDRYGITSLDFFGRGASSSGIYSLTVPMLT